MPVHRTTPALFSSAVAALLLAPPSGETAPLEVYGRLPSIEQIAIAPDGSRLAQLRTVNDQRLVEIVSIEDRRVLVTLRAGSQKVRSVRWADDNHIMIFTSATDLPRRLIGSKREWMLLQIYDVANHRLDTVPHPPRQNSSLDIMNVIAGRVMVRRVSGHTVLFFEGLCLYGAVVPALIRVDLGSGMEEVVRRGTVATVEWLVDGNGQIIAEEDYYDKQQRWALAVRHGDIYKEVISLREGIDVPSVVGFGPAPETLLLAVSEEGFPVWKTASLRDGTLGGLAAEHGAFEAPVFDFWSSQVIGGWSVGADGEGRYAFFEAAAQARWDSILKGFEGARVHLESASQDFRKVVVVVDGPTQGYKYSVVDVDSGRATPLGEVYAGLHESLEVRGLAYSASDGLRIPAFLTLPPGREPRNLPLVLLPHGGPAGRDTTGFDWWSQALAAQGYAVLRPNFRGSALPGGLLPAGFGQWGRKMQTDLADGVGYLAKEGIVDPKRVCVVGASYGGYAALAGITLSPGVYRCAVSIAGLSDLKRMLKWVNQNSTKRAQRYWDRYMGVTGPDDAALNEISPIRHVDAVEVPVLLIHGRDDTVVPFEQSEVMLEALRRAKKPVELVELKQEDHWLSRSETRLQMLQATVAFLRAHNPPG